MNRRALDTCTCTHPRHDGACACGCPRYVPQPQPLSDPVRPPKCDGCAFILEHVASLALALAPGPGQHVVNVHHECPSCGRFWTIRCQPPST